MLVVGIRPSRWWRRCNYYCFMELLKFCYFIVISWCGLLLQIGQINCLPNQIKIGILLHKHQYEQEILFKWSIEQVNQRGILDRTKLLGLIRQVEIGDSWDAEKRACELLADGAIAIIGPLNPKTSHHVGSICDALDVPHLNVIPRGVIFNSQSIGTNIIVGSSYPKISPIDYQSTISVDLSISPSVLMKAYLDLIQVFKWKQFVYLYEQDDSLFHLQEQFKGKSFKSRDTTIRVLRFDPSKPYREKFRELKRTQLRQIVLHVQCSNLKTVLKHAQQVSMMTEAHTYLIVCLDTHTIDLEDFRHSRSRILWLSANDETSEAMNSLASYTSESANSRLLTESASLRISPDRIKIESSLIHDAIETMAHTLQGVDSSQYIDMFSPVSCRSSKPWPYGSTLVNYMRTSVELSGMSGRIRFNSIGQRSNYVLNVMRLTQDGAVTIGNWTHQDAQDPNGTVTHPLKMERKEIASLQRDPSINESEERDTLIVTSIKNEPYFMYKQTAKSETGNARYEGYAIDLIDELSRLVGFDYVFKEVDDGKYGKYDDEIKRWNGMIYEVMAGKADLAIADLSITSPREDAVDFTLPFMSTGISILFKKPTTKELELFSFLSPFENHVWLYVSGAYIGVSSLLFIVASVSPYEWADPHPCRQEDRILRNQFSVSNSFWFTMAALMQQGSDLAPKSLSTRTTAAMWYFFTLIMISSYTANLAAFLTVEKVVYPIEKAEDLYNNDQGIKYGCLESGSTMNFFQDSRNNKFRKMSRDMVQMPSNLAGIKEVEKGNYAFFMESTSIEYTVERRCNLTQIGGLLDSKGYGIAIAKNSTRKRDYRTELSGAILGLQESGILEVLKTRWWKEKRGGGACDIDDGQGGEGVKELTLANVGGVFVVLGMGITISMFLCAMEIYAKSYRLASAKGVTVWSQVKRRVDFAFALSDNY